MNQFEVECPSCHAALDVGEELLGQSVVCPKCGNSIQLPVLAGGVQGQTPPQTNPVQVVVTVQKAPSEKGKVCSILALVFGILTLMLSLVPCVGGMSALFGLAPLVLGIVGTVQSRKKGMAISGIVLGAVSILFGLANPEATRQEMERTSKQIEKQVQDSLFKVKP